jgi:hypothetical protein
MYIQVNIGSLELAANHMIHQEVEVIEEYDKYRRLASIMKVGAEKSRPNRREVACC